MRPGQSKAGSLAETVANLVVGMGVSLALNSVLLPVVGLPETGRQNIELTLMFTGASVIRSYWMRRFFNYLLKRGVFV